MASTDNLESREARMFLCAVTRNVEIALDSASIHSTSLEIQELKKRSEARSAAWSNFLFSRVCNVDHANEPRWYKIEQLYRPCKSLYNALKNFPAVKVQMSEACVQTDVSFLRSRTLLKDQDMASLPTEDDKVKRGVARAWRRVFCCGRQ